MELLKTVSFFSLDVWSNVITALCDVKKIARINLLNKSQTLTVAKCWIGKEEFEPSTENSSNSSNLDQMKHKQNADKYTCDWKQKDYDCSAIKMLTCQYSGSVNRHDIVNTTNGLQKCSWADWLTVEKKIPCDFHITQFRSVLLLVFISLALHHHSTSVLSHFFTSWKNVVHCCRNLPRIFSTYML